MAQRSIGFGTELRRKRLAAGLTLDGLARLVHYSKGQLSKVERGVKKPSRQLARLCDAALCAEGSLAALVREEPPRTATAVAAGDEEVWVMELAGDGRSRFAAMSRRQAVALGAASVTGMTIGRPERATDIDESTLLGVFRSLFDQYRRLGQTVDSGLLLPALIAQTNTIRELSTQARSRTRRGLLRLGSRYAEYVGWLVQETGDENGALWWTQRAVELAAAGDDQQLAAYAKVRRALVTLYRDDAEQTVELARQAQNGAVPPRIRGLALQREAQGHALAGEHDVCMRLLDRAHALLSLNLHGDDGPVIGTTSLADPAEMVRGWCLYDLGRPRLAAEIIDEQLARVPRDARRARLRFGTRRALAYAAAGEVDHACHLTRALLGDAMTVGSATVTTDLRKLAATLARHPKNTSVRALTPELGTALRTITT